MKIRMNAKGVAVPALLLLAALAARGLTATSAESLGVILKPIEDGYVDSLQPTVNFAGSNLVVEYFYIRPQNRQRWGFLLFDLSSIPPNSTVQSAELYLYAFEVHGVIRVGAFRSLDTSWSEKDLYWTLARQFSVSQTSNNSQQVKDVSWYHFDVRRAVQDSLSAGRVTLVVRPDYPQGFEYAASAVFYSNDQPGRPYAPRLEIVYASELPRQGKQESVVRLNVKPSRVQVGVNLTLEGVLEVEGSPLAWQPIHIEYSLDGHGWEAISTVKTDPEGRFTLTWKAEEAGSIKIRARYAGDQDRHGSESVVQLVVESPVTEEGTDLKYPALVTIIVLVSVSILALLWRIRMQKPRPRPEPRAVIPAPAQLREESQATGPIQEMVEHAPEPLPKMVAERVSTGHGGLDRLLDGGLRAGYAVALTSPTCDELDRLTRGFLEAGVRGGLNVLYVTTRLDGEFDLAQKYPSRFNYLICNPQAAPKEPKLQNVHILKSLDSLTEINLNVSRILEEMEMSGRQKAALIDIVSDVLLQHGAVATRQWLLDFISRMKSKSVTMLAIVDSQMHSSEDLESVVGLFDGQISLWEETRAGAVQKLIRVRRMYRERYSDEVLPFSGGALS
ncbi:MAG: DNRLRE domain-containing protein [Candidatus Bathyarchaeia archaeon]